MDSEQSAHLLYIVKKTECAHQETTNRNFLKPILAVEAFQKVQGEGKRADVAEYFRRNTCIHEILGNICQLHVFFIRKVAQDHCGSSKN